MTPAELQGWIAAGTALVNAGITVGTRFTAWVRSVNTGATDEEIDAIVQGVIASARQRRQRIAAEREALRSLPGWVEPEPDEA